MAHRDLETIIGAEQAGIDYSYLFINEGFRYRPAQTDDPEGTMAADGKSYRLEQGKVVAANMTVTLTNNTRNITDVQNIINNGQPLILYIGRQLGDAEEQASITISNVKKVGLIEKPASGSMSITFEGDMDVTYQD